MNKKKFNNPKVQIAYDNYRLRLKNGKKKKAPTDPATIFDGGLL